MNANELARILYDESLTDDQRRTISAQMESEHPIVYARLVGPTLYIWVKDIEKAYRIDDNGRIWGTL